MKTLTKKGREQAKELCAGVPRGPWEARPGIGGCDDMLDDEEWCVGNDDSPFGWGTFIDGHTETFCKFVAGAREALPAALATIDMLEAKLEAIHKAAQYELGSGFTTTNTRGLVKIRSLADDNE